LLLVLAAQSAHAEPRRRVVLLGFPGQAAGAEAGVAAMLRPHCTLVPRAVLLRATKKLPTRGKAEDDLANAARKIGIDAMVVGRAERDGKRWKVTIDVLDGASGESVGTVEAPLHGGAIDGTTRRKLGPELLEVLGRVRGTHDLGLAPPSAEVEQPAVATTPDPTAEAAEAGTQRTLWRASAGPLIMSRRLSFAGGTQQGYAGGFELGVSAVGELRPVSWERRGDLVFDLGYQQVFGATTSLPAGGGAVATTQRQLSFGTGFEARLGEAIVLGPRAGYGYTTFALDPTPAQEPMVSAPDVAYHYLDLGARGGWRVIEQLVISVRGSYRHVLRSGQITKGGRGGSIFLGDNGSTWGFAAGAGLRWQLASWFELELTGDLARFSTSFEGTASVQSASDLILWTAIQAGVRF
jgi:hypothetical protein